MSLQSAIAAADEARSTHWLKPLHMSSLALVVLSLHSAARAQAQSARGESWLAGAAQDSYSVHARFEVSDIDLFRAVDRVYDRLLSAQSELDEESRRVLYEHLWDLYDQL